MIHDGEVLALVRVHAIELFVAKGLELPHGHADLGPLVRRDDVGVPFLTLFVFVLAVLPHTAWPLEPLGHLSLSNLTIHTAEHAR